MTSEEKKNGEENINSDAEYRANTFYIEMYLL